MPQPSRQGPPPPTAQKPVLPDPNQQSGAAPAKKESPPGPDAPGKEPETLTPHALFKKVSPAVAWIEVRSHAGQTFALGTGFFVDTKGTLVTNCHVALADGAAFLVVRLPDETTYFADEILAVDRENDLAVVKVKASGSASLDLCIKLPEIGDKVFAIGDPNGLQNTISEGLVSGLRGPEQQSCIQTTAAISPGSSGGPLVDARGEVVGVTTFYLRDGQNLNFAMPAALVAGLLNQKAAPQRIAALSGDARQLANALPLTETEAATAIDLTFVPRNAVALWAIRPSEILSRPGMQPAARELNKAVSFRLASTLPLRLDVEKIEIVKCVITRLPEVGDDTGLIVLRYKEPLDWLTIAKRLGGTLVKGNIAGTTYYHEDQRDGARRLAFYFPDDRSLIAGSEIDVQSAMISGGKKPPVWADEWRKVATGHAAAMLDLTAVRRKMATEPGSQQRAPFAPIWDNGGWLFAKLQVDRQLDIAAEIVCASADDAGRVDVALRRALGLARGGLDNEEHLLLANDAGDLAGAAALLIDSAREAIDEAKQLVDGSTVYCASTVDLGLVERAMAALADVKSEGPVEMALDWLARQQRKDGSWSLKGPYRSGAINGRDIPESATAMALLAFQGAGHTHLQGEYKKQVADGMKALLKMQGSDGNFFQEGGSSNHWFYAHGQCTIAICELYGMTNDAELKHPAELAVKYCIDTQEPDLGGWRYLPRSDSDTSVTGWITMALQSARKAGLDVPSRVLKKIGGYLDKVTPDGGRYAYQVDMEPTLTMTAAGLACRQHLGWKLGDPRLVYGADLLMKNLPRYEDRDVYYWYYGTRVMRQMEGKYWAAWNGALRDILISHQETTGLEKGSWDPLGEHPDRWANLGQGGRLYTTCLSLMMLEADLEMDTKGRQHSVGEK